MSRILIKLAVILFAVILLLLGIEFILRYTMPTKKLTSIRQPSYSYRLSSNSEMLYELRPLRGENNSAGLRDVEHSIRKPLGVTRIAIIGDSIAYGKGISMEDTYAKQLETLLKKSKNISYEILNFAVPGYSTKQILESFKEKVLKYEPDILIYGYWFNDSCDEQGYQQNFFKDMRAPVWETYVQLMSKNVIFKKSKKIMFNSELIKRTAYIIYKIRSSKLFKKTDPTLQSQKILKNPDPEVELWRERFVFLREKYQYERIDDSFFGPEISADNYYDSWRYLRDISDICRMKSIKALLLLTPVLTDFKYYEYEELHELISMQSQSLGFDVIDSYDAFALKNYKDFQISENDNCHLNRKGHKIISETIAAYLKKSRKN